MKNNENTFDLDLSEFEKIEDIIFLDEPILTHYRNNGKDFLLYLVDTLNSSDILLLLEVNEDDIFNYITGKFSLRNIIEGNKNFSYIIERDFNDIIIEYRVTKGNRIDEMYLPSNESYLNYKPTIDSYYYTYIKEFEQKSYLRSLRAKAFYLKFAPTSKKYADTIGLNQLANILLSNISSSFKSFLKADFFEEFKYIITDKTRLDSTYKKLLPDLDLRMVDLKYGSFEIGLSVDRVMKGNIEDTKLKNWAVEVGDKFRNIVLNDSYNDESANEIVSKYSEADRRRIFTPLFNITESTDFNLLIKKKTDSDFKRIKNPEKTIIEKIIPTHLNIVENKEKDYEILNFTTIVDKNNIGKTIDIGTTLFSSTNQTEVIIDNSTFKEYGFEIDENISIPVNITAENHLIKLLAHFNSAEFEATINNGKLKDGIEELTCKIYQYIKKEEEKLI